MESSKIDWGNPEVVIEYFEQNQIELMLLKGDSNLDDKVKIHIHYLNALLNKTHYQKGLKHIENLTEIVSAIKLRSEQSNHLELYKGIFMSRMKKYREAYSIFKSLHDKDPDSHLYREWFNHTKFMNLNWAFNTFYVAGTLLIIANYIFSISNSSLSTGGILLILGTYLAQYYFQWSYQRKVNKTIT